MPATPQSVDKASDLVTRMQALIGLRSQARLAIADNPDVALTPQQVADLKAGMLATFQTLRDAVKTEVGTW